MTIIIFVLFDWQLTRVYNLVVFLWFILHNILNNFRHACSHFWLYRNNYSCWLLVLSQYEFMLVAVLIRILGMYLDLLKINYSNIYYAINREMKCSLQYNDDIRYSLVGSTYYEINFFLTRPHCFPFLPIQIRNTNLTVNYGYKVS